MMCLKNDNEGFTLLEVLVALLCISVACSLLLHVIVVMKTLSTNDYLVEDKLALHQMRFILAQSKEMGIMDGQLKFYYQGEPRYFVYDRKRIVKREGYEIFMQEVDDASFEEKEGCFYMNWKRKKNEKQALLTCE